MNQFNCQCQECGRWLWINIGNVKTCEPCLVFLKALGLA